MLSNAVQSLERIKKDLELLHVKLGVIENEAIMNFTCYPKFLYTNTFFLKRPTFTTDKSVRRYDSKLCLHPLLIQERLYYQKSTLVMHIANFVYFIGLYQNNNTKYLPISFRSTELFSVASLCYAWAERKSCEEEA